MMHVDRNNIYSVETQALHAFVASFNMVLDLFLHLWSPWIELEKHTDNNKRANRGEVMDESDYTAQGSTRNP